MEAASARNRSILTRRRFIALFAASTGVALVACGPSATPPDSKTTEKPPAAPATPAATAAPAAKPAAPAASPAAKAAAPAPAGGSGELVVALQQGGASNDPPKTTAITDWAVVQALYNGLLRYKPGGFELEPDLAESWDISSDGKEYVFKLKRGVEFHKEFGEFTAEDVKFSIERQLDENFKGLTRADLWMIDRVEAVDKYTAKFVLKNPYAPFLDAIALGRPHTGAIVSKAAADRLGNDNYTEHPIGTGPFIFENQIPNQTITFVANPRYHEGPPRLARVKMINMPDETTLGLAVEKGEVHVGNAREADFYEKYKDTATTQMLLGARFNLVALTLNMQVKPLDDVRVRRALGQSMNAPEVIQGVLAGIAEPASAGIIHPNMLGYNASIKPWAFELDSAKRLLAEAGASSPSLTAVTYTGSEWTTVGALLQQHFANAGVNFKYEQLERATLNQRRAAPDNPLVLISFTTGPDPDRMMGYFHSDQRPPDGLNFPRYSGADALIDQSRRETDPAKRARIISDVQAKFAEDVPALAMYHNKNMVILSKKVQNYELDALGGHFLHRVSLA